MSLHNVAKCNFLESKPSFPMHVSLTTTSKVTVSAPAADPPYMLCPLNLTVSLRLKSTTHSTDSLFYRGVTHSVYYTKLGGKERGALCNIKQPHPQGHTLFSQY